MLLFVIPQISISQFDTWMPASSYDSGGGGMELSNELTTWTKAGTQAAVQRPFAILQICEELANGNI